MSDLLVDVETLKNILLSCATGGASDNKNYRLLRDRIVKVEKIKKLLPRFFMSCRNLDEFWGYIKQQSPSYQGRRDFLREGFHDVLTYLENEPDTPSDDLITNSLVGKVNAIYIKDAWTKALERRELDPEGAITSARTLLESVCKYILDDYGIEYDDKSELPQLYKGVQKCLKLSPDDHTEDIFKQILGGCTSIITGLGAVRNKLSDAHGRSPKMIKPSKRHAQLAVNLAGTMADFLFSTWEFRQDNM
ncbi:MAG: abortive infection family protein [Paenibacillaceae bacterium]